MLNVGQESTYNKQHQNTRVANIDSRIFKISLLWNGESLANNNINIHKKQPYKQWLHLNNLYFCFMLLIKMHFVCNIQELNEVIQ